MRIRKIFKKVNNLHKNVSRETFLWLYYLSIGQIKEERIKNTCVLRYNGVLYCKLFHVKHFWVALKANLLKNTCFKLSAIKKRTIIRSFFIVDGVYCNFLSRLMLFPFSLKVPSNQKFCPNRLLNNSLCIFFLCCHFQ